MEITIAASDAEIDACYPVMAELRPHLTRESFIDRVRRQQKAGYTLAYGMEVSTPVTVAGFRLGENLAWGRFLYVDDLVTLSSRRGGGFGKLMLRWLVEHAAREGCVQLHLDSGVQRTDAHRFYEREGMTLASYHFKTLISMNGTPRACATR